MMKPWMLPGTCPRGPHYQGTADVASFMTLFSIHLFIVSFAQYMNTLLSFNIEILHNYSFLASVSGCYLHYGCIRHELDEAYFAHLSQRIWYALNDSRFPQRESALNKIPIIVQLRCHQCITLQIFFQRVICTSYFGTDPSFAMVLNNIRCFYLTEIQD